MGKGGGPRGGRITQICIALFETGGKNTGKILNGLVNNDDVDGSESLPVAMDCSVDGNPSRLRIVKGNKDVWKNERVDITMILVRCSEGGDLQAAVDKTAAENTDGAIVEQWQSATGMTKPCLLVGVDPHLDSINEGDKKFQRDRGKCYLECCCYHPVDCRACFMPKHPPQFLNKQYGMLLAHEFSMVYSELSTTATGGVTKAQENSNISELFRVAVALGASKGTVRPVICPDACCGVGTPCAPCIPCMDCWSAVPPVVELDGDRLYPCCCGPCARWDACFFNLCFSHVSCCGTSMCKTKVGCRDALARPLCADDGWLCCIRCFGPCCCGYKGICC